MIESDERERRREMRAVVGFEAGIRPQSGAPTMAVVTNLSGHGCGLYGAGSLREGHTVWLRLPGLESWEAVVAWRNEQRAGLRFVRPLHPAVVDQLSAR